MSKTSIKPGQLWQSDNDTLIIVTKGPIAHDGWAEYETYEHLIGYGSYFDAADERWFSNSCVLINDVTNEEGDSK